MHSLALSLTTQRRAADLWWECEASRVRLFNATQSCWGQVQAMIPAGLVLQAEPPVLDELALKYLLTTTVANEQWHDVLAEQAIMTGFLQG